MSIEKMGSNMLAMNGLTPVLVSADSEGNIKTCDAVASTRAFKLTHTFAVEGAYVKQHFPYEPQGSNKWLITYLDGSATNAQMLDFSINDDVIGFYANNEFSALNVVDRYGAGIIVTGSDILYIHTTEVGTGEASATLTIYVREFS